MSNSADMTHQSSHSGARCKFAQHSGIPYATAPVGNLLWRVPDSTYTLDGHPRWLSQLCAVPSPRTGYFECYGDFSPTTARNRPAENPADPFPSTKPRRLEITGSSAAVGLGAG